MPKLIQTLQNSLRTVWDFVYPPICVWCEKTSETEFPVEGLCRDCIQELNPPLDFICPRCGATVGPYTVSDDGCIHCHDTVFHFDDLIRLNIYRDDLQKACVRSKGSQGFPLTAALTRLLLSAYRERWASETFDLVVPIPHHWSQRFQRSHNPAATMAAVLRRSLKVPDSDSILTKSRRPPAQTSLTPAQRRENLRGVFQVPLSGTRQWKDKHILLVDDVFTTGTTANQATRVLKQAGVRRVTVAVLARGIGVSQ